MIPALAIISLKKATTRFCCLLVCNQQKPCKCRAFVLGDARISLYADELSVLNHHEIDVAVAIAKLVKHQFLMQTGLRG